MATLHSTFLKDDEEKKGLLFTTELLNGETLTTEAVQQDGKQ